MPLDNYGVVVGQYDHFDRDDQHQYGSFYHGHIFVRVPNPKGGGTLLFNCAVDVKYPDGNVQYFHPLNLDASKFAAVNALGDGHHYLDRNSTSGALDYIRNPLISLPLGCGAIFYGLLNLFTHSNRQIWEDNVGNSALSILQAMLSSDISKIYVFGARYDNAGQSPPQGMHDVHYNQGDPPGQFQHLDGIWQDGGVIIKHSDGRLEGFFVKFISQSLRTNDQGLPI